MRVKEEKKSGRERVQGSVYNESPMLNSKSSVREQPQGTQGDERARWEWYWVIFLFSPQHSGSKCGQRPKGGRHLCWRAKQLLQFTQDCKRSHRRLELQELTASYMKKHSLAANSPKEEWSLRAAFSMPINIHMLNRFQATETHPILDAQSKCALISPSYQHATLYSA